MKPPSPRLLLLLVAVAAALGAGLALVTKPSKARPAAAANLAPFSEPRAYALVKRVLAYGPRPAGSMAERRLADALVHLLPGGHFEAVPGGLRNIVGELPGREPAIVLGAHYDTTPVPGYVGANNSAAGVAAVIEIARDLARDRAAAGEEAIDFVLFDGEEAPAGATDFLESGLRGSKAYVEAHGSTTREMVLLDFIAVRNEQIARDAGSNPQLWARLRSAAAQVGAESYFPDRTGEEIYDDDTPFNAAGIPAIDLIAWPYACWQKDCDTLGQVSQASLGAVGETVLALMRDERGA